MEIKKNQTKLIGTELTYVGSNGQANRCPFTAPVVVMIQETVKAKTNLIGVGGNEPQVRTIQQIRYTNCTENCALFIKRSIGKGKDFEEEDIIADLKCCTRA